MIEQHLIKHKLQEYPLLLSYYFSIKQEFYECEASNDSTNFFANLSKVIRLDAKLVLLGEEIKHIDYFGLTQEEIIKQIEHDSKRINQELYGYQVNDTPHVSLVFNTV